MKKFFVVMFVVFFAATSAYAVDFQTSGMYEARGTWISNPTGLQTGSERDPVVDYGYYDHELDMTTRIVVDDNTVIVVNYEIQDTAWNVSNRDGWKHIDGEGLDDNIEFKRVFSSHTFAQTGTTLDLGLMTGGAWATDFANNANGRYRVKVTQATPIGPIIGILEKNVEIGANETSTEDAEKDDGDFYYLAMVTKLGPVNVKPLLGYGTQSQVNLNQNYDGLDIFTFQLGIDGAYDGWGFESDFVYTNRNYDWDNAPNTVDSFGAYGKIWGQFGAANLYGLIAYANEDEGYSLGMGDDFEPLYYIGYQTGFGGSAANDYEIQASTLYMIGVDYAATEALSFNAAIAYVDSNADAPSIYDGASAWEFDIGGAYKISDAVKYDFGFGYADYDLDDIGPINMDPDGSWRLYHRFQINF
jgi:hypothetical protein